MRCFSVATLLLFSATPLIAQTSSVREIEMAAAGYARSLHLAGKIVFDPRPDYQRGRKPPRTREEISSLAQQLGATSIADQSQYLVCSSAPKICRMRGADAIISINRPEVVGDTAYVIIRRLQPSPLGRTPITRREDRLLIVNAGGSWRFVKLVGGGSIT